MRDYYFEVLRRHVSARGNLWLVPYVRVIRAR